nr:MAG TPA: hypothetical protein [Caudoviricetes sp.]
MNGNLSATLYVYVLNTYRDVSFILVYVYMAFNVSLPVEYPLSVPLRSKHLLRHRFQVHT